MSSIEAQVDEAMCLGIIDGAIPPIADAYAAGITAYADGKGFHECPWSWATAKAMSWRLGWNEKALNTEELPYHRWPSYGDWQAGSIIRCEGPTCQWCKAEWTFVDPRTLEEIK